MGRKITLRVKAGAREDRIIKISDNEWEVHTTAVAEKGKANQKIIKMIARDLGVAKSRIVIVRGGKISFKVIEIE